MPTRSGETDDCHFIARVNRSPSAEKTVLQRALTANQDRGATPLLEVQGRTKVPRGRLAATMIGSPIANSLQSRLFRTGFGADPHSAQNGPLPLAAPRGMACSSLSLSFSTPGARSHRWHARPGLSSDHHDRARGHVVGGAIPSIWQFRYSSLGSRSRSMVSPPRYSHPASLLSSRVGTDGVRGCPVRRGSPANTAA